MRRSPATQLLTLLCAGLSLLPPAPAWAGSSGAATNKSATGAAPAVLLAEIYRDSVDLNAYWVSEKYDGVRAIWDGRANLGEIDRCARGVDDFAFGVDDVAFVSDCGWTRERRRLFCRWLCR